MTETIFCTIWEALDNWNYDTKKLYETGIDTTKHDKKLYDIIIILLETHFSQEQMDFIIWSIFDDTKELPTEHGNIRIDRAELCWEYLNKFKQNTNE